MDTVPMLSATLETFSVEAPWCPVASHISGSHKMLISYAFLEAAESCG